MRSIRKDDIVKIVAGKNKGTTGKVLAVFPKTNSAVIEGVGQRHRHVRANQLNPRGSTKDIHVPVPMHKLALVVDEKSGKTSRVGYVHKVDGGKARVARQLKNKEIK